MAKFWVKEAKGIKTGLKVSKIKKKWPGKEMKLGQKGQ